MYCKICKKYIEEDGRQGFVCDGCECYICNKCKEKEDGLNVYYGYKYCENCFEKFMDE